MNLKSYGLLLSCCVLMAGCQDRHAEAISAQQSCQTGTVLQQTQLWFGLSQPGGRIISPHQWQQFVDQAITPAFPQGLSVIEATGQWLGHDGVRVRESSQGVLLIYQGSKEKSQAIDQICARYRQLFSQDSVMRIDQPVCVAF
ncbi:DUF3574 domain-containing protein [Rosenbergiella collisarenosi]|uniref:DUF3574 domain-containing protein n=1 Tax=Rosenbergiella collisarenosi TaxID=1544695 RepID=UPI001F4F86DF|nr:DUF3574 domain-containing protein [Rosenbergiella collisarenosi]